MTKEEILKQCTVIGNTVKLPAIQLERKLYTDVQHALELIGGKWNRSAQGFVFLQDPTELLEQIAGGEKRNIKKEVQFFATPAVIADWLVELAQIKPGQTILEPSAGRGAIVQAIQRKLPNAEVYCYELETVNRNILSELPNVKIIGEDFLSPLPEYAEMKFYRIIANPPFSKNQDTEHVRAMYACLKPGGRLVSIMSTHWQFTKNRTEREFKEWLESVDGKVHEIPAGKFKESGTTIPTVAVVIDKPLKKELPKSEIETKKSVEKLVSDLTPEEHKQFAETFIKNLSPAEYAQLKGAAIAELVAKHQNILEFLFRRKEEFTKERQRLYEEEKAEGGYQTEKMRRRQSIGRDIEKLKLEISHQTNIILALENGGTLQSFSDKKGETYTDIPSFVGVNTDMISFDEETILLDLQPVYVPVINEEVFARKGYLFDAIRIEPDLYIVAINGYQENVDGTLDYHTGKYEGGRYPTAEEQGFVLVTLDQLVLINDYYHKKAKAVGDKDAADRTKRQEEYYDKLPLEKRAKVLNQKNYYTVLPVSVKKKISQADYEALDVEGKEKFHKPYKRYGSKRLTSKLDEDHMWVSFHKMYERFLDPLAVQPKPRFANHEVFVYWEQFREMMKWKLKDIKIAREVDDEGYKTALETSFGDSNTNDSLLAEYGILVKRQNGDAINPMEIDQIKEAWVSVQQKFFNLYGFAIAAKLKISHTGARLVFASKAVGMFIPKMGTLAISAKYGDEQFSNTLAHESTHFFDHMLGEATGRRYMTDDYESLPGKIAFAFRKHMNEPSDSDYINATKECFARALEQYYAIETHGEAAEWAQSSVTTAIHTYFTQETYASRVAYYDILKPMIEKFLEEQRANTLSSPLVEPIEATAQVTAISESEHSFDLQEFKKHIVPGSDMFLWKEYYNEKYGHGKLVFAKRRGVYEIIVYGRPYQNHEIKGYKDAVVEWYNISRAYYFSTKNQEEKKRENIPQISIQKTEEVNLPQPKQTATVYENPEIVGENVFINDKYAKSAIQKILHDLPANKQTSASWNFGYPSPTSSWSAGFINRIPGDFFELIKDNTVKEKFLNSELVEKIKLSQVTFTAPFAEVIIISAHKKSLNPRGGYKMFKSLAPTGQYEYVVEFSDGKTFSQSNLENADEAKKAASVWWKEKNKRNSHARFEEKLQTLLQMIQAQLPFTEPLPIKEEPTVAINTPLTRKEEDALSKDYYRTFGDRVKDGSFVIGAHGKYPNGFTRVRITNKPDLINEIKNWAQANGLEYTEIDKEGYITFVNEVTKYISSKQDDIKELQRQLTMRNDKVLRNEYEKALHALQQNDTAYLAELSKYGEDIFHQTQNHADFLRAERFGYTTFQMNEYGWYETPEWVHTEDINFRIPADKQGMGNKITLAQGPNGKWTYGKHYTCGGGAGGGYMPSADAAWDKDKIYATREQAIIAATNELKNDLLPHINSTDTTNYKPAYIKAVLKEIDSYLGAGKGQQQLEFI